MADIRREDRVRGKGYRAEPLGGQALIELAPPSYARLLPALRALPINHLFARAVLEGVADGQVWVNEASNPALVHVAHPYGMTLLFGEAQAVSMQTLRRHLHSQASGAEDRWMQVFPADQAKRIAEALDAEVADPSAPPGGPRAQLYTRANFRFAPERFAAHDFRAQIPQGMVLRPMNEADFLLAGVSVSPACFWRNAAQFHQNGGGWCIAEGDEVAAIAFSSFRFDDELEIGVETRP